MARRLEPISNLRASRLTVLMPAVFLLTVFLLTGLNGCILAPAIDSFKRAGITEADRERLLTTEVRKFQEARYWSDSSKALARVVPESRGEIANLLKRSSKEERVVESKIEGVEFSEDSYRADIEVRVRAYRVPFYVVQDRVERQEWRFSVADGWRLVSSRVEDAAPAA